MFMRGVNFIWASNGVQWFALSMSMHEYGNGSGSAFTNGGTLNRSGFDA